MMPDLFNYWLTGRQVSERTIASTSQCLDPYTGDWAKSLIEKMGIPVHIFPDIVQPGTVLGDLLPAICAETNARHVSVIAPGCHDTASAVAAVPAETDSYAYLSSGTWSLMGVKTCSPSSPTRAASITSPTRAACATPSACSRTSAECG